jgi:hypothetical protein
MIYCTIGVPSRFSEGCERLLGTLVDACGTPPELFVADGLDQVGRELLMRSGANTIILSRQPKASFCKALAERPFLLTLDDPVHALGALMTDYDLSFPDAVRCIANSLSAMPPLLKAGKALVLKEADGLSQPALATAMAAHFGLDMDKAAIRSALERCAPAFAAAPAVPMAQLPSPPTPLSASTFEALNRSSGMAVAQDALNPLWAHMTGEPLGEIVWSPQLFGLGDAPGEVATSPIDATGRERCLIFGPYIRLPEGPWSCSIAFGCSERAMGLRLAADVFAGVPLNRVNFEITEAGMFEIEFSFVNSNADIPLEVRLFSTAASFEGEIMLGQVRMLPLKARRLAAA